MHTFVMGLGHQWCLIRAVGRNPLVRRSDRLEVWALALAILAIITATPIAGAIGTAAHESHSRMYAEQARTHPAVTATAIQDSTAPVGPTDHPTTTVRARWRASGVEHTDTIRAQHPARAGQQFPIWIDSAGDYLSAPVPANQAAADAIGVAILFWLGVAALALTTTMLLRRWLGRLRFMQWDSQFRDLVDNDGHRRSQP